MGILNVMFDFFLDGGKYDSLDKVFLYVKEMIDDGVYIIDIGGELIRSGVEYVLEDEEMFRVILVIEWIIKELGVLIFVDMYKVFVVDEVVKVGVFIINDIWGVKYDLKMVFVVVEYNVLIVFMYNCFERNYNDLLLDMLLDLMESVKIVVEVGVEERNIIFDSGIGFVKIYYDNLVVMNKFEILSGLGYLVFLVIF